MQIARNYLNSQHDWLEDFGSRGAGGVICEQCQTAFIGARRRKICRRCYEERELARYAKEQSKLDGLALAKAIAAGRENQFRSLVSLHHAEPRKIEWGAIVGELVPPLPCELNLIARSDWRDQRLAYLQTQAQTTPYPEPECQPADVAERAYSDLSRRQQSTHTLAKRIIVSDTSAYPEALEAYGSFAELLNLGIGIDVTVDSPRRLLVEVVCVSDQVIPTTAQTLTSTGKLSEKNLPRARHQEIYQDHVCSAMLRVARECFAVLPIEFLLLNGKADIYEKSGGGEIAATIYSVLFDRTRFERLMFATVDPSDAISDFPHRGDFKASRKAGAFSPVEPLTFAAVHSSAKEPPTLSALRAHATALRTQLQEFQSSITS